MNTPSPAPKLTEVVAAHLDASPKVREDWRDFFKFRSVQWTIISVANGLSLAVPAYMATTGNPLTKSWPLWANVAVGISAAIGVFYGVLTKQKPKQPDDSDSAGA